MPKKDTDIERILKARFENENIPFEFQKPIKNIAVVDFLIKGKVIVQADGDYFHALPKMKQKDARQDKILGQMGYTILRFLGSTIKQEPEKCVERVKNMVKA